MDFTGIIVPLMLPLHPDGEIDWESLERLLDFQLHSGVDGIFLHGTAGEGNLISLKQRMLVTEKAVGFIAGRIPILCSISDTSTIRVKENIDLLRGYAIDAYVCTLPFYAKTSESEQYLFFSEISECAGRPLLLYNMPSLVKCEIALPVIARLAREKRIAGVKETSPEVIRYRNLVAIKQADPQLRLFTGYPNLMDIAFYLGFDGAVMAIANVIPELCRKMHSEWRRGDIAMAQRSQAEIIGMFDRMAGLRVGDVYSSIPVTKMVLQAMGIFRTHGQVRPYLASYPADDSGIKEIAGIAIRSSRFLSGNDAV